MSNQSLTYLASGCQVLFVGVGGGNQGYRDFSLASYSWLLSSADIQDRTISRGFLSGDRGLSTSFFAGTPIRRHADTIAFCGCGFAALRSSVHRLVANVADGDCGFWSLASSGFGGLFRSGESLGLDWTVAATAHTAPGFWLLASGC